MDLKKKLIAIKYIKNRLPLIILTICMITCLFGIANANNSEKSLQPEQFIANVINPALFELKKNHKIDNEDKKRIVEKYILPYINFEKSTRLASGKYWENMNTNQKIELSKAFRNTLIVAYSGAISKINNHTEIKIFPNRSNNLSDVIIRTLVIQNKASTLKVGYRIEKDKNTWKIYDVNIEGIWLVESYKNQFKQILQTTNVENLINQLNKNN
ncbi:putative phospholipid-binding protein MlaC [Candidatus Kinetoplastibacterium sorsogonicusi]|uniref:Putative phospholipid-binding protein MlaC n=2 Tax=Candidatus Kinetoplastidibacterium kentomonadis TaxID=1576550 RepID=A0A3Q8EQY3_9PROT|nr:putative phospholipid-binding protein MlaC [Candidatus Kinetoplastibacterium sorsogonicusi]